MTIEEAIKHCEEVAEAKEKEGSLNQESFMPLNDFMKYRVECLECASEHRQLAEWLKELKTYREFADWLVKAVFEDDWEESADFYAEVICRKLTKLGKLKVVDNKYMEINANDEYREE